MTDRDDPRRSKPVTIRWDGLIGRLTIDGESWGAIEFSEKRQAWCIEDAEGQCLRHKASIHGQAAARYDAIALAETMIRDGRMPSPEQAKQRLQQEHERRAQRPSEIRRRHKREEIDRLFRAEMAADDHECEADREEGPLYELVADALDLTDPELWKSNSFARLRDRLITTIQATIAQLEYHRAKWGHSYLVGNDARETEKRLARAREILALLQEPKP